MNSESKIERLLAMILLQDLKDDSQTKKAKTLNAVGFSNPDIAELLGTTPKVIAQQLYAARSGTESKVSGKTRKLRQSPKE